MVKNNSTITPERDLENSLDIPQVYDLNAPTFWSDWVKAGGSTDDYFKDTMPNYALVGALLLTISIPSVLNPPSFGFNGEGESNSHSIVVYIFAILMNISTMASMALIWLSCAILQQYTNAYSKQLRTNFSMKFGYLVTLMTILLTLDGLSLFGALFVAIAATYDLIPTVISIAFVGLGFIGTIALNIHITSVNASMYSTQMKIDLAFSPSKPNKNTESTEENLLKATQTLQEALSLFAKSLPTNPQK